jgi:hypothetical protein
MLALDQSTAMALLGPRPPLRALIVTERSWHRGQHTALVADCHVQYTPPPLSNTPCVLPKALNLSWYLYDVEHIFMRSLHQMCEIIIEQRLCAGSSVLMFSCSKVLKEEYCLLGYNAV